MKTTFSIPALSLIILISGCNKDPDQSGCTDPIAINYEPQALSEDGSCTYNSASQSIWSDGEFGGWNGDMLTGAYTIQECQGFVLERIAIDSISGDFPAGDSTLVDSVQLRTTLVFLTDEDESHRSYFTLVNDRNARDFAEGSLRFECRIPEEGSPELFRVFIGGKLPQQGSCHPYRRSDYITVSTNSLNDSTFTPIEIPIRAFDKIMMANVEVVFGLEFDATSGQGLEVDNIRWTANKN